VPFGTGDEWPLSHFMSFTIFDIKEVDVFKYLDTLACEVYGVFNL